MKAPTPTSKPVSVPYTPLTRLRRAVAMAYMLAYGAGDMMKPAFRPAFSAEVEAYELAQKKLQVWCRWMFVVWVVFMLAAVAGITVSLTALLASHGDYLLSALLSVGLSLMLTAAGYRLVRAMASLPVRRAVAPKLWRSALWAAIPQLPAAQLCEPRLWELVGCAWLEAHAVDGEAFAVLATDSQQSTGDLAVAVRLLQAC